MYLLHNRECTHRAISFDKTLINGSQSIRYESLTPKTYFMELAKESTKEINVDWPHVRARKPYSHSDSEPSFE